MHPLRLLLPVVAVTLLSLPAQAQETTLQGEPFGYVKVSITPGTGTTKKVTLFSVPLLEEAEISGLSTGRIASLSANSITAANPGWTSGELSAPATPYLLEITSGEARGRMFLISATTSNTTDTVTIDVTETARVSDLRTLGITAGAEEGDTFKIRPVDTLSSFFGTPDTTLIMGGAAVAEADSITMVVNGSSVTYFYNTAATPPRWARVGLGSPDASNTPIMPHSGLQYGRVANTALEFIVTGRVPAGQRQVAVKRSGTTLLAPFWPVSQTLADLALHAIPEWGAGASASTADTVALSSGGSLNTYFYDGTNWRRVGLGSPLAGTTVVPVGTSVMINRKGAASDFVDYEHSAPYNLQ